MEPKDGGSKESGSGNSGAGAGAGADEMKISVPLAVLKNVLAAFDVKHVSNVDKSSCMKKICEICGMTEQDVLERLKVREYLLLCKKKYPVILLISLFFIIFFPHDRTLVHWTTKNL